MFDGLKQKATPSTSTPRSTEPTVTPASDSTVFQLAGSKIIPTSEANNPTIKVLPGRNYVVKTHPDIGFYLDSAPAFIMPKKIYGDTTQIAAKIMTTFLDRPGNTGVLLTGEKGGGKSLLAKLLGVAGADMGIPTIIVAEPYHGTAFFDFLGKITQPAIILIDEYEKTYQKTEHQESMLTLLDGVFSGKKLFVLTCNEVNRVDRNMKNRPGRLYYRMDYTGLSMEFIKQYAEDVLIDKSRVAELCAAMVAFGDGLNFDMLKAVVEEVNRYPGTVMSHLKLLNVRASEANGNELYNLTLTYKGIRVGKPVLSSFRTEITPMREVIRLELNFQELLRAFEQKDEEEDEDEDDNSTTSDELEELLSFTPPTKKDRKDMKDARAARARLLRGLNLGSARPSDAEDGETHGDDFTDHFQFDQETTLRVRSELEVLRSKFGALDPIALAGDTDSVKSKAAGVIDMNIHQAIHLIGLLDTPEYQRLDYTGCLPVAWTPDELTDSSMMKGMFEFTNSAGLVLRLEKIVKKEPWDSRASAYSRIRM